MIASYRFVGVAIAIVAGTYLTGQIGSSRDCFDRQTLEPAAKPIKYAWRTRVGTSNGSPVVYKNLVLLGTNNQAHLDPTATGDRGVLACFDLKSGAFLWQRTHERLELRASGLPDLGICARPFIENGRVYYYSSRGEMVCIDLARATSKAATGGLVWKLDLVKECDVFRRDAGDSYNPLPAPIVVGDLVYCVSGNGSQFGYDGLLSGEPYVPKPTAPSFVAVHKNTGRLAWSSNAPGARIAYGQWGSPAVASIAGRDEILFPGGDGLLYSFDTKGTPLFAVDLNEAGASDWGRGKRGTRSFTSCAPSVYDGVAYLPICQDVEGGDHGQCAVCAVSLEEKTRGRLLWRFDLRKDSGSFGSVLQVPDKTLIVLSVSGQVFGLDATTGKRINSVRLPSPAGLFTSPCMAGGKLLIATEDSIVVLSADRNLKVLGTYELDDDDSFTGTPAVVDGMLYIATMRYLYAMKLTEIGL